MPHIIKTQHEISQEKTTTDHEVASHLVPGRKQLCIVGALEL